MYEELLTLCEALVKAQDEIKNQYEETEEVDFKVGDKVRVKDDAVTLERSDFGSPYGVIITVDMFDPGYEYNVYFEDCVENWWFSKDMLELVEDHAEQPLEIIFDPQQVKSAAEFLSENSRYLDKTPEEFEEYIYNLIKKEANGESTYVGTAGFYVLFSKEDSTVYVDVLVYASVGQDPQHVSSKLINNKLVVEF